MLYRLIWGRFTACQMANAVYDNVAVETGCAGHSFRASYSELLFPGYTAVYEEEKDEEGEGAAKRIPNLAEGEQAVCEKLEKEQRFTQPPSRYNRGHAYPRDGGEGHRPPRAPTRPR